MTAQSYEASKNSSMAMTFKNKKIFLAVWPSLAAIVFVFQSDIDKSLPAQLASDLSHSLKWLAVIGVLYIVNYWLAWRYKYSWSMTLGRSLVAAFFAYICISNIVDIFGINKDIMWQILGQTGRGDPILVIGLRALAVVWTTALAMCVVCISIGFEKNSPDNDSGGSSA